jgi:hypothetical protein
MDVSALKVADTAAIHVKNAAGEPLYDGDKPVRIIIYGPGSRQFATVETRQTNRAVRRMAENDGKITAATAEERVAETAEDLAAVTVAFENLSLGDKQGHELFLAVYGDPALGFIARQVSRHLADWGNFKPGSAAA